MSPAEAGLIDSGFLVMELGWGAGSLSLGSTLQQGFHHPDKDASEEQVHGQTQGSNRDHGASNPIPKGQNQDTSADFTAGPHPDGQCQSLFPVCFLTVNEGWKHLSNV